MIPICTQRLRITWSPCEAPEVPSIRTANRQRQPSSQASLRGTTKQPLLATLTPSPHSPSLGALEAFEKVSAGPKEHKLAAGRRHRGKSTILPEAQLTLLTLKPRKARTFLRTAAFAAAPHRRLPARLFATSCQPGRFVSHARSLVRILYDRMRTTSTRALQPSDSRSASGIVGSRLP